MWALVKSFVRLMFLSNKPMQDKVMACVQKQVPQPIVKRMHGKGHSYYCPICDEWLGSNVPRWVAGQYCHECGQRLK